jgi:uncharacterized protein (DUF1499 family)
MTALPSLKLSLYLTGAMAFTLLLSACSGTRPITMGDARTSIDSCPETPNCVSSLSDPTDDEHFINALASPDGITTNALLARIAKQIDKDPDAELIVNTPTYLYAEYTSDLMQFIDDVEFLSDTDLGIVEVRSASRIGRSDFGVNRSRIDMIRQSVDK